MKKIKILYTCTYSAGGSGVWNRVKSLAKEMISRGHKVYVFSSNLNPDTQKEIRKYEKEHEIVDEIEIFRFKVKSFGSKNAFDFGASYDAMERIFYEIKPNIVDCQTYRHSEGNITSKLCEKYKVPCLLTTHAPFVDKKVRGWWLSLLADVYDRTSGGRILKSFSKIIAITKWEYPHLRKLGVEDNKIEYIPNGIPKELLKINNVNKKTVRKIVFFGRIAPVKSIETLIKAISLLKDREIKVEIIGPVDLDYKNRLDALIKELKLDNVKIKSALFNLKEEVQILKSSDIYVLPSIREGMPQTLVEAMGAGCLVISSDIDACKEIIGEKEERGLLFKTRIESDLAEKLDYAIKYYPSLLKIRKDAKKFASNLTWDKIANKIEKLYLSSIKSF